MKILAIFIISLLILVGCGDAKEVLQEEIVEETLEEEVIEKVVEEAEEEKVVEKEILDITIAFYSSLIGKDFQEIEEIFEGEELDLRGGKPEDPDLTVMIYDRRVAIQFENSLVGWVVFFEDVNILGFKTTTNNTPEEIVDHFGQPNGKGPFQEKGEYYEYFISDMILVFFFTPHYEEVHFSAALFKP